MGKFLRIEAAQQNLFLKKKRVVGKFQGYPKLAYSPNKSGSFRY